MDAEIDMRTGVSEVSNVEFERNSDLNLSSREDPCEIGGECNGIVHDIAEEIDGDAKDDTDGSYVFVNPLEKDHDADCVIDPTEASKIEIASEERIVSESNVDPMKTEERQVEVQELRDEKGKNSQSFKEETDVSVSNHDLAVGDLQDRPDVDEVVENDTVKEQNKTEVAESESQQLDHNVKVEDRSSIESLAAPEENLESQDMVGEVFKYKLQQLDNEDKRVEDHNKLDSDANLKENQKVEVEVIEAVEHELHQHNDGEDKVEELGKMELFTDIEDHQESEVMVADDVESNLDQEKEAEKVVDEFPLEGPPGDLGIEKLKSNLDQEKEAEKVVDEFPLEGPPGDLGIEKLKSKLDQEKEAEKVVDEFSLEGPPGDLRIEKLDSNLDHEKEAEKLVDEIPLEGPPGDLGIEKLKSEMAVSPVNNAQSGTEGINGSAKNCESFLIFPADDMLSRTIVVNNAADGSRNMPVLNEFVSNAENLPCPIDDLKSETEVGNIPIEGDESLLNVPVDAAPLVSKVRFGSILISESFPTCAAGDTRSETEFRNFTVESSERFPSFPVKDTESEPEIGNDSVDGGESMSSLPFADVKSKSDEVSTCTDDTVKKESENMGVIMESASDLLACSDDVEMKTGSMETGSDLPSYSVADKKLESVGENVSCSSSSDMPSTNATELEYSGSASKCVNDGIDVEIEGDLLTSGDGDDKPICQEAEGIEEIQRDETTQSSPKGSTADDSDGRQLDAEVGTRPFQFLIRTPRYIDDKIREKIRLAQLQVDERTQSRDAIRAAIQMKRVTCSEYRDNFEAAKSEEVAARDVLTSKRQEIESVQTVVNKIKNATSIDDIDVKIHNMEHMIEHETMPLKEEKQLIREIKQLKHIREQLSSNTGGQDELQQALDQRDKIEERFKLLKRELDSLRKEVLRTEGRTKAARKKYIDENEKLKELRSQFKAADDFRQQAYTNFQNLRKELYEKNKYFRTYKDDVKAANDYAFAGDKEALQRLCVNQVETVMDLWNKNDEFRSEYVRCNTMSTLRRLRTLDGRSLGPDEAPPILRNFFDERVDDAVLTSAKINSTLPASSSSEQENPVLSLRPEKGDAISVMKVEQKSQTAKPKKPTRATVLENGSATGSGREETERHNEEENKRAKQEEELARKAEELRKEEAAAKLKEQRRLEEKAKAKEAEERRRRNAEKAQARSELRAQKEAESREKERAKRAKKKERKREAAAAQATTDGHEGECAENGETESTLEPEIKEKPVTVAKRSQKPAASLVKQTKTKPIPLPLRNKGKRRMQQWMWILLAAMLVVVLFLAGNIGNFSKFKLPNFGF